METKDEIAQKIQALLAEGQTVILIVEEFNNTKLIKAIKYQVMSKA